jgi:predicted transcriptional regulator
MADASNSKQVSPQLVSKIVGSYVKQHAVAPSDISALIISVHQSLCALGNAAPVAETRTPAVSVRQSMHHNYVICLECGWKGQMLRSHLTTAHELSPAEYRARWRLKNTHPIIAPAYTARRSAIAKQLGLGRKQRSAETSEAPAKPAPVAVETALDPAFIASLSAPKRRGRPRTALKA